MKLQPLFSYQAAVNREKRVAKTKQNSEALPVPTALNTALKPQRIDSLKIKLRNEKNLKKINRLAKEKNRLWKGNYPVLFFWRHWKIFARSKQISTCFTTLLNSFLNHRWSKPGVSTILQLLIMVHHCQVPPFAPRRLFFWTRILWCRMSCCTLWTCFMCLWQLRRTCLWWSS